MMDEPISLRNINTLSALNTLITLPVIHLIQPGALSHSPSRVSTAVVEALSPGRIAVLDPDASPDILRIKYFRPELAQLIAGLLSQSTAVPRDQVKVPICPVANVTDTVLFEDAADATKKFYLPCYRLAQQVVSGQQEYRIVMEQVGQGWRLTLYLETYPAPEVAASIVNAAILPHTILVILSYSDSNGVLKELPFQEVTAEGGGVRAVLLMDSLAERDQVYYALTDQKFRTSLVVRRVVNVAIPVPQTQVFVASSGTGLLRGTFLFDFDTGTQTTAGADVWWEQQTETVRDMKPWGNAQIANIGAVDFDSISFAQLQGLSYSTVPINGNNDASNLLINGDVFAVHTNSGNYAKVQVLNYGYNLNIKWITYTTTPVNTPSATTVSSGTSILQGTYEFDFDSGLETATDADVWWEQETDVVRDMQVRNGAQITNIGVVDFESVTPAELLSLSYGTVPLRGNNDVSNVLINGDVFAVHTTAGNYAKVQVLNYGYNLNIRWVTYKITPQSSGQSTGTQSTGTNLYQEVTRTLDNVVDPNPFVFPPALYGYIFSNITPDAGTGFRLIRRQVGPHSYYQDTAPSYRFYYLPDTFKIARAATAPFAPIMQVRFKASGLDPSPQSMQATLYYVALPFVDTKRLEADAAQLKSFVQDPLPPGVDKPELVPLAVDPKTITYRLGLPGGDAASGPYRVRTGALVDLLGIHDEISALSMADFQAVFDAFFSQASPIFEGQIEVDLGSGATMLKEVIPFIGRMNDLVGDIFTYNEVPDDPSKGVKATFQNAIESTVRINSLAAQLQLGQTSVAGVIQGLSLPLDLPSGKSIAFVVAPSSSIDGTDPLHAIFDISGVETIPDREAIWNEILDPTTSDYTRVIHVKTFRPIFDPPQDHPENQVLAIDIILKRGTTGSVSVELTARSPQVDAATHELQVDAKLPSPISDYILHKADPGEYTYQVTTVRQNQSKTADPKTHTDDSLWILTVDLM